MILLLVTALLTATPAATLPIQPPTPEATVRAFVDAFNARDLDALVRLADDDIEWLSVDGHKIGTQSAGAAALRESLAGYFKQCASCKSTLEWTRAAGSRVVALERASWTTAKGDARAQVSLSVYELRNGRILRVYYFPAERETQ